MVNASRLQEHRDSALFYFLGRRISRVRGDGYCIFGPRLCWIAPVVTDDTFSPQAYGGFKVRPDAPTATRLFTA